MAVKNAEEFEQITVPSKTLEALFGVKDRTIRDLADKGIVARDSHGKYLFWNSAKGYITALKIANAGKAPQKPVDREEILDWEEEKAQHEKIKRQITEIKLQLIKGQVHKAKLKTHTKKEAWRNGVCSARNAENGNLTILKGLILKACRWHAKVAEC